MTDDLVETGDGAIRVDGVVHEVGEGLASELVDDVQDLDHPAAGGDIELVVQGPHVIWPGGVELTASDPRHRDLSRGAAQAAVPVRRAPP